MKILRDRAAGPSSFCTNILHLPITLHSPWLPVQVPQLPTSPAHTAHIRTRVPRALLTAGIEDTFLHFEIVLCKTLPKVTCTAAFSQRLNSVQQFGLKAFRFGKTKGCTAMLEEQKGKLLSAKTFSWAWGFSSLSPWALHSLTRFKTHFSLYIPYLPTPRRFSLSGDARAGIHFPVNTVLEAISLHRPRELMTTWAPHQPCKILQAGEMSRVSALGQSKP